MDKAVQVFIYAVIAAVVLNILLTKCIVWIVKCFKKQSPMERAQSTVAVAIERPVTQQQPKSIREKLYYQFFE